VLIRVLLGYLYYLLCSQTRFSFLCFLTLPGKFDLTLSCLLAPYISNKRPFALSSSRLI